MLDCNALRAFELRIHFAVAHVADDALDQALLAEDLEKHGECVRKTLSSV